MNRLIASFIGIALAVAGVVPGASAATIVLINGDPPGAGLNDPAPVAPVPGNPATTLGDQRLAVFQRALDIWGAQVESPVPIRVRASFPTDNPNFGCAASPGAFVFLGFAGPASVWSNFPNAPFPGTLYPAALRNALAGDVIQPDTPEIQAIFNPFLDTSVDCLTGYDGYWYGLDPASAPDERRFPLLPLVLHEIGHGLGFFTQTNLSTGAQFFDSPTVYDRFLFDLQQTRFWDQMSDAQRVASAISNPNLVWAGSNVQRAKSSYLPLPLRLRAGADALAGGVQQAAYGPLAPRTGLSGEVVAAVPADGCAPLTNAAQTSGRLVLTDRGTCAFQIKSRNAEDAGAIAVLVASIADEAGVPLPTMIGTDYTLTLPSVLLSFALGNQVKSLIGSAPSTNFTLEPIPGAAAQGSNAGFARMHAPATLSPGSSVVHFSAEARGRLMMLPTISASLFDRTDMAPDLLRDIGWRLTPGTGVVVFEDGFD